MAHPHREAAVSSAPTPSRTQRWIDVRLSPSFTLENLEQRSLLSSSFAAPQFVSSTTSVADSTLVVDVNGDGIPDLVQSVSDRVVYRPGRGDGTFGRPVLRSIPGRTSDGTLANRAGWLITGDLTGDGRPEILAFGQKYVNRVYHAILRFYSVGSNGAIISLGSQVFDGGQSSFQPVQFVVTELAGIPVLVGVRAGTNTAQAFRFGGGRVTPFATIATLVNTNPSLTRIRSADLDGDGHADLAFMESQSGFIRLFRNAGPLGFVELDPVVVPGIANDFIFGDLNGDGSQDLVVGDNTRLIPYAPVGASFDLHLGLGAARFGPAVPITVPTTPIGSEDDVTYTPLVVADTNDDGRPDLVFTDARFFIPGAEASAESEAMRALLVTSTDSGVPSFTLSGQQIGVFTVSGGIDGFRAAQPFYFFGNLGRSGIPGLLYSSSFLLDPNGTRIFSQFNTVANKPPQIARAIERDFMNGFDNDQSASMITLRAAAWTDPDADRGDRVQRVRFFFDSNGDGVLSSTDEFLGSVRTPDSGGVFRLAIPYQSSWGTGYRRFFEVAFDTHGAMSAPVAGGFNLFY